jgi:ubiquinone biosynthesis protein Coq4
LPKTARGKPHIIDKDPERLGRIQELSTAINTLLMIDKAVDTIQRETGQNYFADRVSALVLAKTKLEQLKKVQ